MVTLRGDRPLGESDPDRLGFRPIAARLAKALASEGIADGIVIGIEGRWGSGKSSLLSLVTTEIGAASPETRIVDYKPWLVHDRDALLTALFDELALAVEATQSAEGNPSPAMLSKAKRAAGDLREFAKKVSKLGPLASFLAGSLPFAGPTVDAVRQGIEAVAAADGSASLAESKKSLARALGELGTRVVVTIDDVDRLEPLEAVELLRLVRAVADFPNVTYVLCYDSDVLSRNVQTALGVKDGQAFVEKIVQVVVPVPTPEAFDLRRWFSDELAQLTGSLDRQSRKSIDSAVDVEGGRRLTTPRAVVRTLDALRLKVPALKGEVDLGDLVWLELVKVGNLRLYRWIEAYCAAYSAMWPGRVQVSEESSKVEFATLQKILARDGNSFKKVEWELDARLPGIGHGDQGRIFTQEGTRKRAANIRGRRLSSPDHQRLYFALSPPRNAVNSADLEAFEAAAQKSSKAISQLLEGWLKLPQTSGVTKAEVVLGRLDSDTLAELGESVHSNLLLGIADVLDVAATTVPPSPFGSFALWHSADSLWQKLLPDRDDAIPRPIVLALFEKGRSTGWLSELFRGEWFAYGRAGEAPRGGSIITELELDAITPLMIARYRDLGVKGVLALPESISALWGWYQAGDQEFVRSAVANFTKSDRGLLTFLAHFTGIATSSEDGERKVISRSSLDRIVDFDAVVTRLEQLAGKKSPNAQRATQLLGYMKSAVRF